MELANAINTNRKSGVAEGSAVASPATALAGSAVCPRPDCKVASNELSGEISSCYGVLRGETGTVAGTNAAPSARPSGSWLSGKTKDEALVLPMCFNARSMS